MAWRQSYDRLPVPALRVNDWNIAGLVTWALSFLSSLVFFSFSLRPSSLYTLSHIYDHGLNHASTLYMCLNQAQPDWDCAVLLNRIVYIYSARLIDQLFSLFRKRTHHRTSYRSDVYNEFTPRMAGIICSSSLGTFNQVWSVHDYDGLRKLLLLFPARTTDPRISPPWTLTRFWNWNAWSGCLTINWSSLLCQRSNFPVNLPRGSIKWSTATCCDETSKCIGNNFVIRSLTYPCRLHLSAYSQWHRDSLVQSYVPW